MRSAPSVSHPVGRSRSYEALLLVAWLCGLATLLLWLGLSPRPGWRHALGAAACLGAAGVAWRSARAQPRGTLAWDGSAWSWQPAGDAPQPVRLELAGDLQQVLLLRLHAEGAKRPLARTRWLWLSQRQDTTAWQALRRAVYFSVSAGPRAQPGAAAVAKP